MDIFIMAAGVIKALSLMTCTGLLEFFAEDKTILLNGDDISGDIFRRLLTLIGKNEVVIYSETYKKNDDPPCWEYVCMDDDTCFTDEDCENRDVESCLLKDAYAVIIVWDGETDEIAHDLICAVEDNKPVILFNVKTDEEAYIFDMQDAVKALIGSNK